MRNALIGVAVVASVSLAGLAASEVLGQPYRYGVSFTAAMFVAAALAMALAAIGLIKSQAWAAYLLSAVAFLCALPIVGLMLFLGPGNWRTQPATGFDQVWLILWGALALPLTVGGVAIAVGGDLSRKRRERAAPGADGE